MVYENEFVQKVRFVCTDEIRNAKKSKLQKLQRCLRKMSKKRKTVPSDQPILVSELVTGYIPKPKMVNSEMYSDIIRDKAGPAINDIYPDRDCIFQDDNATIHRSAVSLAAVAETFDNRIQPSLQASKMADVYPIENVWIIVKTQNQGGCRENTNVPSLKRTITSDWKEIDRDKELCKKLMASIPKGWHV